MNIQEDKQSLLNYSQAVVRITKQPTLATAPLRYNKVTVLSYSPSKAVIDPITGGLSLSADQQELAREYLEESELNQLREFYGIIKLHNDLEHFDQVVEQAKLWGLSLILTSAATTYLLDHGLSLPNEALYCWLTHNQGVLDESLATLAVRSNVGVMINQASDSRLVYAITMMMRSSDQVVPTNRISNDAFAGVVDMQQADALAERGVSFWLRTQEKCYPFALFLGQQQAYVRYYDAIIEHEVKEAVAAFIHQGQELGQLELLGNRISMALGRFAAKLEDNLHVRIPKLSALAPHLRKAGVVQAIELEYTLFGELRSVAINL